MGRKLPFAIQLCNISVSSVKHRFFKWNPNHEHSTCKHWTDGREAIKLTREFRSNEPLRIRLHNKTKSSIRSENE